MGKASRSSKGAKRKIPRNNSGSNNPAMNKGNKQIEQNKIFEKNEKRRDRRIEQIGPVAKVNDARKAIGRFELQEQKQLLESLVKSIGFTEELVSEYMKENDLAIVSKDVLAKLNEKGVTQATTQDLMDFIKKGKVELVKKTGDKNTFKLQLIQDPWTPLKELEITESDRKVLAMSENCRSYKNNRYHVYIRKTDPLKDENGNDISPSMIMLSIKRNDGSSARSWRDFQRIKNELVGVEAEAVELFPKETRLQDSSNQFFLYCLEAPNMFPFGSMQPRMVTEAVLPGGTQDQWEADNRPADLLTLEQMLKRMDIDPKDIVDSEKTPAPEQPEPVENITIEIEER